MKKHLKTAAIVIAALIVIAGICGIWVWSIAYAKYPGDEPVRIYVPRDATEQSLTDSLTAKLGRSYSDKVLRLWRWQKGNPAVANGSYLVTPDMKAVSLSRRLLHGRQSPVKVTFNNLRTFPQLAQRIAGYLEISPDQFTSACDSVLRHAGFSPSTYIAAFVPDTYEFYWNAPAATVVSRLLDARNAFWTDERLAKAANIGLSKVQVATLASIIEEETAKPDELPLVARLYLNRLNQGMLLQADPTVKFATGDFALRRIGAKHLAIESPYNTYKHPGLPPGPIRLASQRGIDAVLNAPMHPYLYMCAKEDFSGYHNFTADYNQHRANARKYQAELNKRNIK